MKHNIAFYLYLLVALLVAGQVYLTSRRATEGDMLTDMSSQLETIKLENERMKSEIYNQISLANVRKFALENSLVPVQISNLGVLTVASRVEKP